MHDSAQYPKETVCATLIMEAQNPASTRSLAVGMTRLYKAEGYYLDLSSSMQEAGMVVSGQILPVHADSPSPKGEVRLLGEAEAQSVIGAGGDFRLGPVLAGQTQLEVHLESLIIQIAPF
jgi:hypothetical protein